MSFTNSATASPLAFSFKFVSSVNILIASWPSTSELEHGFPLVEQPKNVIWSRPVLLPVIRPLPVLHSQSIEPAPGMLRVVWPPCDSYGRLGASSKEPLWSALPFFSATVLQPPSVK